MSARDASLVLVHSPLVGPSTWGPVARALEERGRRVVVPSLSDAGASGSPTWRTFAEVLVSALAKDDDPLVLVAHSGAGPFIPVVGDEIDRDVRGYAFVDATIPARQGRTPVVPPAFLDFLARRAEEGRLPRWSRWWDEEDIRAIVPDPDLLRRLDDEMPRLPLSYFEDAVPVPPGWPNAPCAFLRLSEGYEPEAVEAESRGWPTARLSGEHLHMVVAPEEVAGSLLDLLERIAA